MAVYTDLNSKDIEYICSEYALGPLRSFSGIAGGMENSNYFIVTTRGEFVLTLFEELCFDDIPFYNQLLINLKKNSLKVAAPLATIHNQYQLTLKNKPVIVCPKISGDHPNETSIEQCMAVGSFLGEFHLLHTDQTIKHQGIRSFDWFDKLFQQALPLLPPEEQNAVTHCYQSFSQLGRQLPIGLIHADLFRDNVLFINDQLTGVLDFYCVSQFYSLFDIAIAVNDWCRTDYSQICPDKKQALCDSYSRVRTLHSNEITHLNLMCQVAAMRFWFSRLLEQNKTQQKSLGIKKAPDEYRALFYYWESA